MKLKIPKRHSIASAIGLVLALSLAFADGGVVSEPGGTGGAAYCSDDTAGWSPIQ